MLNKKTNFILATMLGCFILLSFIACNNSETKPADTDAETKKTEAAPAVKDTAPVLDTTAAPRPLKPGT